MKGESTDATIARISTQLEAFRADGGFELLASQFADDELVQRPRGKPQNTKNKTDVLTLKVAGLSQDEVAEKLGLPTSTVNDYWKLKRSKSKSLVGFGFKARSKVKAKLI